MIICPSTALFGRQTEKTLTIFNPTKVDITLDGVHSKIYSQGVFHRAFFEEAYRVLSSNNREVSAKTIQILSEDGCSLTFGAKEYYAVSWTHLAMGAIAKFEGDRSKVSHDNLWICAAINNQEW